MIMVDSSVWIDYFCGISSTQADSLDNYLGIIPIAVGDLILTEVLQGFRNDKDFETAKNLFDDVVVLDMLGKEMALKSAENYRKIRKKGITIRKTADVIIATYCIERRLPLLFSDKDFKPFVKYLNLLEA